MSQSRIGSFVEALINVFIGFWISFASNLLILPLVGFQVSIKQNLIIGVFYTMVSVARSYCIRRWFNYYIVKAASKIERGLA